MPTTTFTDKAGRTFTVRLTKSDEIPDSLIEYDVAKGDNHERRFAYLSTDEDARILVANGLAREVKRFQDIWIAAHDIKELTGLRVIIGYDHKARAPALLVLGDKDAAPPVC